MFTLVVIFGTQLIASTLLSTIFFPIGVSATPETQDPLKEEQVYQATFFLTTCAAGWGFKGGATRADMAKGDWIHRGGGLRSIPLGPINQWGIGMVTNDGDVTVGYSIKGAEGGKLNCKKPKDIETATSALNIDATMLLIESGLYKLNSDGSYDPDGSEGDNDKGALLLLKYIKNEYPDVSFDKTASRPAQYMGLKASLSKCVGSELSGKAATSPNAIKVDIVDEATGEVKTKLYESSTTSDERVGFGKESDRGNDGVMNCSTIVNQMNKLAPDASKRVKSILDTGGTISGTQEAEEDGCESNGGVLGWLMCPVVKLLDGTVGFLDQKIRDMLYVKSDSYFGADSDLMTTWKNIRNIAYLILIPIMLVMVIGTALGFEVFSAYTVKKALPRMVIAVIFIALSWYVCVFMVNFTNVLGAGAKGLVTAPLKEEKGTESGDPPILSAMKNAGIVADSGTGDDGTNGGNIAVLGAGTLVAGGALFATGMISIGIIMSTFFTAALILGAIFLLLVFRQMLVIGLVLVAPLAILSWIFPGNDKLWKLWWGSFSKLLLIFPLIMLLAGVGEAFAMITGTATANNNGAEGGQLVALIIIIAAYIMPFLFIPFAFKWAGGVFGNLAGMVNDKNRGALDRLKKGRGNMRAKHMNDAKNFGRFKGRNALTRGLNNIGGIGTNRPGAWMSPDRLRGSRAAGQAAKAAEDLKNDKVFQANQNDDKFLLALGNERLARKKLSQATTPGERAAWEGALANARAVSSRGSQGTTLAALDAHAATGYNYSSGQAGYNELAETYIEALGIDESHVRRDENDNVIGVTGPQAAAYASHMNTAQFNLKKAGRVDLGGINNAEGEDARSAIRKFSNYSRSQQKTETYHGGAEAWLGSGTVDGQTGKTLGTSHEMARAIEASMADGSTDANALLEYHSMLAGDYGSATEANKVEIQKQMEAIEQATANIGAQAEDRLQGSTGPPLPGSAERLIGVDLGSRGRQARQQRGSTPEAERQPEE